jgi:tetratricopeptide (TPR) repeat protein
MKTTAVVGGAFIAACVLLAPTRGTSAEPQTKEEAAAMREEHQYQAALYEFLTNDYFSSSALSRALLDASGPVRDKGILLLKLSETKRLAGGGEYPALGARGRVSGEIPGLLALLDILYRNGEYKDAIAITSQLSEVGAAEYFRGISLLKLKKHDEAAEAFGKVPAGEPIYPYARVAIAQVKVIRHDYRAAEEVLRDVLAQPTTRGVLAERVQVLLGQVLFEEELFTEALIEFMKVVRGSEHYREALLGEAWSLVRLGSCDDAVSLFKEVGGTYPYDSVGQEAHVMVGRCYTNMGQEPKAREHFEGLVKKLSEREKEIDGLITDTALRSRYLSEALGEGAPPEVPSLALDERYYLSVIRDTPQYYNLLGEYTALKDLREAFRAKDDDLANRETYVGNLIKGLERMLSSIEEDVRMIRGTLVAINANAERGRREREGISEQNKSFFDGMEVEISRKWEGALKRKVSDEERFVIRLILHEGESVLECMNSSVVCPIVHLMSPTKADHDGGVPKLFEVFSKDLASIRKGEGIEVEKMLARLKSETRGRVENAKKYLAGLAATRAQVKANTDSVESGLEESRAKLDVHITERFSKLKYEIRDLKSHITTAGVYDKDIIAASYGKQAGRMR